MKVYPAAVAILMLGLAGCEYAVNPSELVGEYRRPHSNETLILRADGTAVVTNMPGKPKVFEVKWSRSPSSDALDCTWLDFEPLTPDGVEWHTCASRVLTRHTVFIGYPLTDPDEGVFYEKIKPARK